MNRNLERLALWGLVLLPLVGCASEEDPAKRFMARMDAAPPEERVPNWDQIRTMMLPDGFIDHDSPFEMYNAAGLNAPDSVATALSALGQAEEIEAPQRA